VRGASVQSVKHLSLHSPRQPTPAQVLSLGPYYLGIYLCLSIASISPTRARSSTLGPCSDHSTRRPAWFARSMARGGWRTGPRTAVDRHFFFLLFFPSGLSTLNIACLPRSTWRRPLYLPFPCYPPLQPGFLPSKGRLDCTRISLPSLLRQKGPAT
jgi:hypothetical protein